jgi:outer membrane protein assembly factor BamD (BamD/ComL family)
MLTRPNFLGILCSVGLSLCLGPCRASAEERTEFPAEARQQYDQGRELRKKGQLKEAIRAFEEAIKLGMEAFPQVHLQRAGSNLELKKYETAVLQYTKFIDQFGLEESCRH